MPFTFAHPVAVLPLRNKYFNLSGLVLGAMAPDFIYFILFSPSSSIGHSFLGFILFNLPMCFLLNYLFYKYIQEVFVLSLPNFISRKYMFITKYKNQLTTREDVIKFSYSCIIGMFTHVLWDAFTHKTGFFVEKFIILSRSFIIFETHVPVYKILQHGSTLVGAIIIFIYLYKLKDNRGEFNIKVNKAKIYFNLAIIQVGVIIISLGIFILTKSYIGLGRIVVTFINSIFIAYLTTGVIFTNGGYKHE